ncbi:MAG: methionine ABC transporter ATP-binding protein [Hyphomonadaceae bacterium BRH_c29]|jgi:putative ABC transport system ATP-binding protein|nr:MAG: methionine ABC transporter ATP-binding protein [Hyphomonadaceae bacterium BRH_c29]
MPSDTSSTDAIRVENLRFAWPGNPPVLDIKSFTLGRGEKLFLRGPSGSGKSTLLGLIAGVLSPGTGTINVLGNDMARLSAAARDRVRADHLGVIFQMFNLVPYLSVTGNVTLPLHFSPARRKAVGAHPDEEARRLLGRLGLTDPAMLDRRVSDLSVGQQQRVAAARALIGGPDIVIADEPTSALDADARDRFIELLSEEASRTGAALLFVSHDASLARLFDRAVDLAEINTAGVTA